MRRLLAAFVLVLLILGAACARACQLNVPPQPLEYEGVAVGLSQPEETRRQTQIARAITGGDPAPQYMPMPRILSDFRDERGRMHRIISVVIDGAIPAPGDHVVLHSRYLNPDNDCQFIPWTVVPKAPTS